VTGAQQKAVQEFLALANAITAALSGDNLAEFNTQALKAHTAVPSLAGAFPNDSPWRPSIEKLEVTAHLPQARI